MQAQYGAHVVFLRVDDLFVVCVHEEGEGDAVGAERRLDDIGTYFSPDSWSKYSMLSPDSF